MYIPTIFFGGTESCVNLIPSQSQFPTGSVRFGQLGPTGSGDDTSYFYVRCEPGEEVNFTIQDGVTTTAKLLLIGGGGGVDSANEGGGAAGDVIFQDIALEPGNYLLSCSANPSDGTTIAGNSVFFTNTDDIPSNQTRYIAYGGETATFDDGGNNTNFTGGDGAAGAGGGGGAGSAGNGGDRAGDSGGDGGDATTIPSPFRNITGVGFITSDKVAGGGGGKGQCANSDGGAPARNQYGSGATYDFNPSCVAQNYTGVKGAAFLYVPIKRCSLIPSGAIDLPTEQGVADGGDLVGTFTSGSDTFKYHIFIAGGEGQTQDAIFSVKTGSIQDAKVLCVAGGGGGSDTGGGGAGGVSITRNVTLYGMYDPRVGEGGAPENSGTDSLLQPISSFVTYLGAEGGGYGGHLGDVANGGSGGGGGGTPDNGGNALSGSTLDIYDNADFYYGSAGGQAGGGFNEYGGGGGGATSNGDTGSVVDGRGGDGILMTGEFFPTNIWVTGSIARGGDGNQLSGGHPLQSGSGDGGHGGQAGANGFISITYKI